MGKSLHFHYHVIDGSLHMLWTLGVGKKWEKYAAKWRRMGNKFSGLTSSPANATTTDIACFLTPLYIYFLLTSLYLLTYYNLVEKQTKVLIYVVLWKKDFSSERKLFTMCFFQKSWRKVPFSSRFFIVMNAAYFFANKKSQVFFTYLHPIKAAFFQQREYYIA